jgi:hypothetical protein
VPFLISLKIGEWAGWDIDKFFKINHYADLITIPIPGYFIVLNILLVTRDEKAWPTIISSLRFFFRHFYSLVRFQTNIIVVLLPLAIPVLAIAAWMIFVYPAQVEWFKDTGSSEFAIVAIQQCSSLLARTAYFVRNYWFVSVFLLLLWLPVASTIFIKNLDAQESASNASSGPA